VRVPALDLVDDGLERLAAPEAQRRPSADVAAAVLGVLVLERLGKRAIALLSLYGSAARTLSLGPPAPIAEPPLGSRLANADAAWIPDEANSPPLVTSNTARGAEAVVGTTPSAFSIASRRSFSSS
jgi:hypothetical protein